MIKLSIRILIISILINANILAKNNECYYLDNRECSIAISLGLTGMKHLNNLTSGSFSGQDFVVDVILDRTNYVKQAFFESLYDETFSKIANELGQ